VALSRAKRCGILCGMTAPSPALRAAARRRLKALADLDAAQTALVEAIRADTAAGVRQVDIVRETLYTREQIRRIVRAGQTT